MVTFSFRWKLIRLLLSGGKLFTMSYVAEDEAEAERREAKK